MIERTPLGAYLRAANENPTLVRAFGINVPRIVTLTYMGGVALAAFAGVLAAPIFQVSSIMGANIIPIIFAVVVIGGLGSLPGAALGAVIVGVVRSLSVHYMPQVELFVIYFVMAMVLAFRPRGLFSLAEPRKI